MRGIGTWQLRGLATDRDCGGDAAGCHVVSFSTALNIEL
jgi:hypothetical protein